MKFFFKAFSLILIGLNAYSGTPDSLESVLKKAKNDTSKVNILNRIANEIAFSDEPDYNKALEYSNSAISLSQNFNYKKGEAIAYHNLGIIYYFQDDYDKALDNYFKSLAIKQKLNDKNALSATYNNIGAVYKNIGQNAKALEYYLQSLKIDEEQNDRPGMSRSYNSIGLVVQGQGNFDQALSYFNKSLEIKKETNDSAGLAVAYNNIGLAYLNKKNFDKALNYYFLSLDMEEKLKNSKGICDSYNNISEVYILKGRLKEAETYLTKAIKIQERINYRRSLTYSLTALADIYGKQGKIEKSIELLKQSISLSNEMGLKQELSEAYKVLSTSYEKINDYKQSAYYIRQYAALRDTFCNEESMNKIAKLQTQYEADKKEKEISLLKKQKEVQSLKIYSLAGGLVLIVLLSGVVLKAYNGKKKANALLERQNSIIEEKNKDITSSIEYAKKIQSAILPDKVLLSEFFAQSFILYKPKDIVSGDFYWFVEKNNFLFIAAADCTGHGVPGAFMSMIGNDQLNHIVIEKGITAPSEILTHLNKSIKSILHQSNNTGAMDGMDIALCAYNKTDASIEFAGAHRPLYLIRDQSFMEFKPDKMAIGGFTESSYQFTNHKIELKKDDIIYLFTDGYSDQFGGEKGKKYTGKRLKETLLNISGLSLSDQQLALRDAFNKWQGDNDQVDDLLIIGIKI